MLNKKLILCGLLLSLLILSFISIQGVFAAEKILEKNPEKNLETQKEPGLVKDVSPVIVTENEKIEKEKSTSSPVIQSSGSVQPGPRTRRPGGNTILQINLTAGVPTQTSVLLNWTAYAGADRYVIQKNSSTGWAFINTVQPTQTSYLVTGLMPRTPYRFRVLALNGTNLLNISNEVNITTLPGTVNFVLGNRTVTANSIELNWTHWPAPRYFVQGNRSGNWTTIMTVHNNSYIVAGLNPGTAYWFRILAVDAQNTLLGMTNVLQVTTARNVTATTISACANITAPGTYVLNQTLYGVQPGRAVCIDVQADNVVLDCDGNAIIGGGGASDRGIIIHGRSNVTIARCRVENHFTGIYLYNCLNGILSQNSAYNNVNGFNLYQGSNNTLTNNTAHDNARTGFIIGSSSDNTLIKNTAYNNNWDGFGLAFSSNNTLINNTAYNNSFGFSLASIPSCSNNIFINNTAYNNGHGFYLAFILNNTFINNAAYSNAWYGFYIQQQSSNNTFVNNIAHNNSRGFYLFFNSTYNSFTNNTAYNNSFYGFSLEANSNYNTLTNNTAHNNLHSFRLDSSSDNVFSNNLAHNNGEGFRLDSSSDNVFASNVVYNNTWDGFSLHSSANNTFTNNTVYNDPNIAYNRGFYIELGLNNTFTNNTIHSNAYCGFDLYLGSSNTLANNVIYNNAWAVSIYSSSNNTLINNTAYSNSEDGFHLELSPNNTLTNNIIYNSTYWGIVLINSNNTLIYNNYLNNTNNAYDDGNNFWNILQTPGINIIGGPNLGGNYWSDYTGIDADGNGIGDTPYAIPGGGANQDYLPLVITNVTNQPPIVDAGPNQSACVNQPVHFAALAVDPDGDPLTFFWDFGDGSTGFGRTIVHNYTGLGSYTVVLFVSDGVLTTTDIVFVRVFPTCTSYEERVSFSADTYIRYFEGHTPDGHGLYLYAPHSHIKYGVYFDSPGLPINMSYYNATPSPRVRMLGSSFVIDTIDLNASRLSLWPGPEILFIVGDSYNTANNYTVILPSVGLASGNVIEANIEVIDPSGNTQITTLPRGRGHTFFGNNVSVYVESACIGCFGGFSGAILLIGDGKIEFQPGTQFPLDSNWQVYTVNFSSTHLESVEMIYGNPAAATAYERGNFLATELTGLKEGIVINGPKNEHNVSTYNMVLAGFDPITDSTTMVVEGIGSRTNGSDVLQVTWTGVDGRTQEFIPAHRNQVNLTGPLSGDIGLEPSVPWTFINNYSVYLNGIVFDPATGLYAAEFYIGGYPNGILVRTTYNTSPAGPINSSNVLLEYTDITGALRCNVNMTELDFVLINGSNIANAWCDIWPNGITAGYQPIMNLGQPVFDARHVLDGEIDTDGDGTPEANFPLLEIREPGGGQITVIYDSSTTSAYDGSADTTTGIIVFNTTPRNLTGSYIYVNTSRTLIYEENRFDITPYGSEIDSDGANRLTILIPENRRDATIKIPELVPSPYSRDVYAHTYYGTLPFSWPHYRTNTSGFVIGNSELPRALAYGYVPYNP